jgi:hypothetical protein
MIKIAKPLLMLGFTLLTTSAFAAETTTADRQLSALPAPISSEELSTLSGGASPTGLAVTNQTLSALNANNSVSAGTVVTGQVSLQPGTFSGFNGIGNFVFNTGNNNNVQGTLSVTILTPPMN